MGTPRTLLIVQRIPDVQRTRDAQQVLDVQRIHHAQSLPDIFWSPPWPMP